MQITRTLFQDDVGNASDVWQEQHQEHHHSLGGRILVALCSAFNKSNNEPPKGGWILDGKGRMWHVGGLPGSGILSCLSARLRVCLANANFIRNFCRSLARFVWGPPKSIEMFGPTDLVCNAPPPQVVFPRYCFLSVSSGSCIWDFTFVEWIISEFCRQSTRKCLGCSGGKKWELCRRKRESGQRKIESERKRAKPCAVQTK